MARLYNFFLRRAQLVTFYMQISDRSLLPPTTTETARVSPACTCIAVGQNLTANKSIYDLQKNLAMAITLNKMEGLFYGAIFIFFV